MSMMKKSKSFVKSLTRSYLWVSLVPILIVLAILFVNTIRTSFNEVREGSESAAELITSQLDSLLENMSFLSIHLTNNIMANAKGLDYSGNTLIKEEQYYSSIQAECCSYAVVSSLYDVVFFTREGYYITSDNYNTEYNCRYRLPQSEIEKLEWLSQADQNYGKSILLPAKTGMVPLKEAKGLTLARAIRDPGNVVGYLCIQIKQETVEEILEIGENQQSQVMIWDGEGQQILYCTENFPQRVFRKKNLEKALREMEDRYLTICRQGKDGIQIVLLSDKNHIYYSSLQSIGILCAEAFAILILTVFFIKYYAEKMTRPLTVLTMQMKKMTLDTLNVQESPDESAYDEIRYLYNGYREMQIRLDRMIHREIASRTLQMQERLNSLQAQINPHFLYNTLNVIGIMGSESDNQKIYDACLKLSSLLRYSIADKNARTSTIDAEMDNISAYFELMKLRFEHRIDYVIHRDQKIGNFELPRLCLQPFAENIFEHAYNAKNTAVHAEVRCTEEDGKVVILIWDDGQGMDEKALRTMKDNIRERCRELDRGRAADEVYGIGIENTILRMQLYFDGAFSYDLGNRTDGGFYIRMMIEEGDDGKRDREQCNENKNPDRGR